jgi:dethiobiotin synthetase
MLAPLQIPGLLVLGASPGAGRTVIAGAIADSFRRSGARVAVCLPIATAAVHRREGLVSEQAEFLAACADARHPLDLICPQRYAEHLIPLVASRRSGHPLEWEAIDRSIQIMSRESEVMIIQAPASLMTPLDAKHTVLDMIEALGVPVVLVCVSGLSQISPVSLAARVLKSAKVGMRGFVINRYPADNPTVDQEASLGEIEKWSKLPLLSVVPAELSVGPPLSPGITAAIDLVDWSQLVSRGAVGR